MMDDCTRFRGRETIVVQAVTQSSPPPRSKSLNRKFMENLKVSFAVALVFADAIFSFLIIALVPYTKIYWDAYMSQVTGFLGGERDYKNLKGDTGPLVYPAGFLYIYSAFQYLTGGEVYPAQILFAFLYTLNLAIILLVYVKTDVVPWWALCLLSLSKRLHSVFMLRLFNDCVAMTLLHAALLLVIHQRWHLGLIMFSGAVSVKMNVLLYSPPLLLLMLKAMDISRVLLALAGAALVQIMLGLPFLVSYPVAYISRAFNLGRICIHFWSVNFKFMPGSVFISKGFAIFLLGAHLILLALFAHYRWAINRCGRDLLIGVALSPATIWAAINKSCFFGISIKEDLSIFCIPDMSVSMRLGFVLFFSSSKKLGKTNSSSLKVLTKEHIVTTMFVGNFIGIVCARSLHYQFYSWYFHSLPYLLWRTNYSTLMRLILFMGVEMCWNIYPSNSLSSGVLLYLHLIILWGLWSTQPDYPYVQDKSFTPKDK